MERRVLVWVVTLAAPLAIAIGWTRRDHAVASHGATIFSARRPSCPIVVPADAIEAELRAARYSGWSDA